MNYSLYPMIFKRKSFFYSEMSVRKESRFSPSACNTQPWFVKNDGNALKVFRYKKPGIRGIMPAKAVEYLNRIDIGIFLCSLEICLHEQNMKATKELFSDSESREYSLVAEYKLNII